MNAQKGSVERDWAPAVVASGARSWENIHAVSTANEAARATAAKRSPGPTITN